MRRSAGGIGLGFAVVSAATFGTSGAFAGSLLEAGWTPGSAVTVRVVVAALVLTPVALVLLRGKLGRLRRDAGTVTVYGIAAVAGAQLCYFNAVQHLSVAVALLLEYSGALLVIGWLWLRHGQRPRALTVAGAAVAVAGLAPVLDLASGADLDPVGVLWGLGAAVGLATYFVLSAGQDDALPPLVVAWGGLAIGGVVLAGAGALGVLPLAAPRTDVVLLDREVSWLVPVLGLSLVAAVVAYATGILGARLLGAKTASFVGLTEVLFAVLFAWLLLDQVLTAWQLVGGLLVLGGIGLVQLDEMRSGGPGHEGGRPARVDRRRRPDRGEATVRCDPQVPEQAQRRTSTARHRQDLLAEYGVWHRAGTGAPTCRPSSQRDAGWHHHPLESGITIRGSSVATGTRLSIGFR